VTLRCMDREWIAVMKAMETLSVERELKKFHFQKAAITIKDPECDLQRFFHLYGIPFPGVFKLKSILSKDI